MFVQETCGGSVLYGGVSLMSYHGCMSIFPLSSQFLGNTEVEAPKGTEVVKDAVRKLKVSQLQRGGWGLDWEMEKVEVIDAPIPSSSVTAKLLLHGCL